jgi:EmrB/QacA subfamily drug resistance transporter
MSATAVPPREANRWLVLAIVGFAQFMVVLDATITNVALPAIQSDLSLDGSQLQWIINGYTLVFGGFLLLGGRAADLLGRRRLFLAGTALFTFASLLNGLATSGEMLVVSRALQGLGGALVSPAALSIITTTFAEGEERTKAMGVWGAIAAGGGAVGLLLGGVLTEALSWEWVFFVNVPIGLGVAAVALRYVPESLGETEHRTFDLAGAVTVTAGLVLLVYAIVEAESAGWGSLQTLGLSGVALVLLAVFVGLERRSPAPLVRLSIFRLRSLSTANAVLLGVGGGMFAMFFFLSLYVQQILGFSPLEAGVAFLPFTAGILIGSGLSAQVLVRRFGLKATLVTGLSLAAAGMLVITQIDAGGSYAADVLPGMLPMAIGMGLTFVPLTLVATANVEARDAGLASGLFNTSQQVGGALGLAILSTLANGRTDDLTAQGARATPAALVEGYQIAFAAGAVLLVLGALGIAVALRRRDVETIDLEDPAAALAAA